jgi:hypothetical protein
LSSTSDEVNIETPSLAKVLKDAIDSRLVEVHTAMPGVIVTYDPSKQQAQVQPSLKRKYADGTIEPLPPISNVPVVHPRGGGASILLPIASGDPCLLVFAERSLDNWKSEGGISDPDDTRKHHLSDAFCIPGGSAFNGAVAGDASNLIIKNGSSKITVDPGGKFKIANTSNELFDLIDQLFDLFSKTQVLTALGPQMFVNLPDYVALRTKFATLKG